MNLAISAVLTTGLWAGCAIEPGADAGEPSYDGEALGDPAPLLDGRAAAAAEAKVLGIGAPGPLALTSQWYSGALAPGASQSWTWNNASLTSAYQVGLSPVGASTSSSCRIEVSRTWDVQKHGGERELRFTIKNLSAITCGANILLASKPRFATWATGGIDAGGSRSFTWNNANPLTASHFVSVSPSGATTTSACQLEVTRTWYRRQPSGERELAFTVKNVGDIACQGDIQLAATTDDASSWSTPSIAPGGTSSWTWNNANPVTRVYVAGLSPQGASSTSACTLEVINRSYRQVLNSSGSTEREHSFTVKNIGAVTCAGTVLLNYLD
jgi:hypothetical protein